MPTPRQLFRQFETGQLSRAEFQAAMKEHQQELIEEMEEAHRNPVAAFIDEMCNRAAAFSLVRRHGERTVREVLDALAELDDFPPAAHLWNALHFHIPLHCFFRTRASPVFRILKLEVMAQMITLSVEYSVPRSGTQNLEIRLRRLRNGQLIEEWRR